ncbi:hypothetical protein VE00_10011 [Pseudogymnoascus sp. WSF 3629]|nr:hypothetical protein VE00_10011 [Pseudogymnoascus sp. WSF 3629]
MAVPYRAKGVPSLSSEFGHPDVAILLTYLSYYYTGMTQLQLYRCLDLILKESDPTHEYARWSKTSLDLPDELKDLDGINIEDENLCVRLFSHLKYNKAVADFFLSRVVFPQEGNEFRTKISSSGWDIPAPEDGYPTTGFSGTNDNRFLLPLSIQQQNLPDLHKTNAEVLNLLLRTENRQYISTKDDNGKRLSVPSLIKFIASQSPAIHVLIDVGAQVLEMRNREVVEEWLKCDLDAKAAVFFDEDDEALVLDRDGHVERLLSSSFHHHLDGCLVYLDEVHTRGVDLKIPRKAHAAVTLGRRLAKDRLVQACMRLRKLGCGQSLVFLGSPDLERSVRICLPIQDKDHLDSENVVRWCLQQTCRITETVRPLWVMQGVAYYKRSMACQALVKGEISIAEAVSEEARVTRFWENIQEPEALTLQMMYGLHNDAVDPLLGCDGDDPVLQSLM